MDGYEARLFFTEIQEIGMVDLHLHSTYSDGTQEPVSLVFQALFNHLSYISITDHDTLEAYDNLDSINLYNLQLITQKSDVVLNLLPGIEISTVWQDKTLHLLAYFPEHTQAKLLPFLDEQLETRAQRNITLGTKLRELGYPLPKDFFTKASMGRSHVARWLVENGYFTDIESVFNNLLTPGKPGYVARKPLSLEVAINEVRSVGGVPVVAHPHLYGWVDDANSTKKLERKLAELKEIGLLGVETIHSSSSQRQREQLAKVAKKLKLASTAGSDYHGENKKNHEMFSALPDYFYRR